VAKLVTRTRTSVMMICRPTHTLSLSLSPSFSLTHSLSLVFSLFPWNLLIKIKFLDISWLKTLFLLMFRKVCIYSKTHPLTRSQKYPSSHKCHINTPFLRVRCQVKKCLKVTQTPCITRYDIVTTLQNKSPTAQASGGSARLLYYSDCSKPVHSHFLKNL